MILNKKGFMMLPLAALLFATSCAKQISYGDAKTFVENNYTSEEPKKPTKLSTNFSANVDDDNTREAIKKMVEEKFEIKLTDSDKTLKYNGDIKENLPDMYVITTDFLIEPTEENKVTYSLSGKSLSLNFNASLKDETIPVGDMMTITIKEAKVDGSAGVNDQGYPARAKVKVSLDATITMNMSESEFTFNEDPVPAFNLKLSGELSVNATY
ncbi:MAG: hypothetical protein MJ213_04770 [Bacilli bacterium]|nr:hypothetical protein [Bacilli bacterium]